MPKASGLRMDDDRDWDDLEEDFLDDPFPRVILPEVDEDEWDEEEDEEDWDGPRAWEDPRAKEETERERESELELIQEDMERQANKEALYRKWYYWEVYLDRFSQRSWKHHRRTRRAQYKI